MTDIKIKLAYLYPDLLNIYGDRGNVTCLKLRAKWHGLDLEVDEISLNENHKKFADYDLFFIGGGQDSQQSLVAKDLEARKSELEKSLLENEAVALAICGGYQILGTSYQTSDNQDINGLGILDIRTKAPELVDGKMQDRLIGNVVAELLTDITCYGEYKTLSSIVGFENHSGRTFINDSDKCQPLAKLLKGFGNNANDGYEGVNYKNIFGTYLHGSFLPKNPHFADELLFRALKHAAKRQSLDLDEQIKFQSLDDSLEISAHQVALSL